MKDERRYLILHGVENRRPPEHWQHWLTEELRSRREIVLYPQLPDTDQPDLATWLELIRAELAQLGGGERIVVCHSLAVLAWFHLVEQFTPVERVDRVLLVAPPSPSILWPEIAAFEPPSALSAQRILTSSMTTRIVCSDNDPYCPEGGQDAYGTRLNIAVDVIPNAGHLSTSEGYGPWPSALQWCLDGDTTAFTTNASAQSGSAR
jgi:predicted alpha/beta hydrolase family esterase